jgi:ABC-type glutathione transport system ATPase component
VPFLFRAGDDAQRLVERLRANRWRGQIIGPHGTGKSTLLHALAPALECAGRSVVLLRPPALAALENGCGQGASPSRDPQVVVIDGFEQLHPLARWGWKLRTRWRGAGLLVTAHRDVGLPTLYQTHVDPPLAESVVAALLQGETSAITSADVQRALADHRGNLRDTLFALYDLYERRQRLR